MQISVLLLVLLITAVLIASFVSMDAMVGFVESFVIGANPPFVRIATGIVFRMLAVVHNLRVAQPIAANHNLTYAERMDVVSAFHACHVHDRQCTIETIDCLRCTTWQ